MRQTIRPRLLRNLLVILSFFFLLPFTPSLLAYERIVSLKPNLTEILFALGVGDRVVGVTSFCDTPPAARQIDKVADYLQPDLEKLVSKKPDLIVTSRENSSRREIEFLIRKGYRVLTFESDILSQLERSILELGRHLERLDHARKIVHEMEATLTSLRQRALERPPLKTLFVVGHHPLVVAGSRNLFDDVAPYLGLVNVAGRSRLKYPTYSVEQVFAASPELILDFSMGTEASEAAKQESLKWWSQLKEIPAVKNRRLFFWEMGALRAGPRLPSELVKLFEAIHGAVKK